MSKLISTLNDMGLTWEAGPVGTWVTLRHDNDSVHFIENAGGTRFYTWCDNPSERTVRAFPNPGDAIRAGLKRCYSVSGLVAHTIYIGLSALSLATAL